ncbi:hypothetical protein [Vibrio hepatarius]|uniref:hypothetical protein n=1 Tax=Vibrio hepatarius TaxID=171383 RepID=UPI00148CEE9A|nr:hypothetical protein [Vibrio hepatarius]NOI14848.1 hypothetical protein [Vibrio hepatarius]
MIINYYTYDKTTLEVDHLPKKLVRQSEMDELPMAALLVEPLEPAQGKAVLVCDFDENGRPQSTEYIPDYRGETIYNKLDPSNSEVVNELGDIKQGWTLKPAPSKYHTFSDASDDWELTAGQAQLQHSDAVKLHSNNIDSLASQVTSNWGRFAEEYEITEAQAEQFKQAGYQGECGSYVTSYAVPKGISNQEATDIILAQAQSLRDLQSELRVQRMRKYELSSCASVADVEALSQEIQTNIKILGESYA